MNQLTFVKTTIGNQPADLLFTCISNQNGPTFRYCYTTERGFEILTKVIEQWATPVSFVISDW